MRPRHRETQPVPRPACADVAVPVGSQVKCRWEKCFFPPASPEARLLFVSGSVLPLSVSREGAGEERILWHFSK